MSKLKAAVIGLGVGKNHAANYHNHPDVDLVAVCDLNQDALDEACLKFDVEKRYTSSSEMFAANDLDLVSIATPNKFHCPLTLEAFEAGCHVLCEKPLATSYAEARQMVTAAKRKGVINMVNLSYRDAPAIQKAAKIIHSGQLGDVRHVEACYLQGWLTGKHWGDWHTEPSWLWRLSSKHGSMGVLGDLGVHILDFASFPVGPLRKVTCVLKTLNKAPRNRIGQYVLDANDTAIITAEFANGAMGTITTTRWATGRANTVRLSVYCEKGALEVDLDRSATTLMLCRGNDIHRTQWKEVRCPDTPNIYQRFVKSIRTTKNDQPDFSRGAEIQKVLDACMQSNKTGRTVAT